MPNKSVCKRQLLPSFRYSITILSLSLPPPPQLTSIQDAVIINARKETKIKNPETGLFLELDIYLPDLNLAFEYQVRRFATLMKV